MISFEKKPNSLKFGKLATQPPVINTFWEIVNQPPVIGQSTSYEYWTILSLDNFFCNLSLLHCADYPDILNVIFFTVAIIVPDNFYLRKCRIFLLYKICDKAA